MVNKSKRGTRKSEGGTPQATYFRSPGEFRRWLEKNHDRVTELLVGFRKKNAGGEGFTYHDALDEALCFGWIDGVRRNVDQDRYTIRFSPRRQRSIWSAVNIRRAHELKASGRMAPAGLRAFDTRDESKARKYSYEQKNAELPPAYQRKFKANRRAWQFFQTLAPSYQRTAKWFVMSAAKEETRERRLAQIIDLSARALLPQFLRPGK